MTVKTMLFSRLSGAEDEQLPDEAGNFLRHVASLCMSKSADGLFDPKLVLSWLLSALAVPPFIIGLLVPIREAGALLPQLFVAARIHAMAQRKWAWALASGVQGAMVALILFCALTLEGAAAGWTICAALAVLALARAVASVSYADVLGRTVAERRRGAATGSATSAAAVVVIVFALILAWAPVSRMSLVLGALAVAAVAFMLGGVIFAGLREEKGAPSKAKDAARAPGGRVQAALAQMRLLWSAPGLARLVLVRGLLVSTALAPPYMVLLAADAGNAAFERLGALVLASSVASLLSSYVWGRLADRSSRRVLIYSGVVGAVALTLALVLSGAGFAGTFWALPLALFVLMIGYHGVRQGRTTYLVDFAPPDKRLAYTAVANTTIGVVLMAAGLVGAVAGIAGPQVTLALFALLSAVAALVAYSLEEATG
jgi:hypothetical protein